MFQVAHYALRPWPWIITGLATVVLYPNGIGPTGDKEGAYVQAFVDLLPTPWRGLMMAGFCAAYMSTVATQLNWGASYLVNDVYRRFIWKEGSEKHLVGVSRATTVVLFLLSIIVTSQLSSVEQAWRFLIGLGAGTGLVYMLRWYWWRINAWSEIAAMVASFVAYTVSSRFFQDAAGNTDALVLLTTVAATTVAWTSATLLTQPEPASVLEAFYRRVRPGGPGWAEISTRLGFGVEQIAGGRLAWLNWLAGVVAVYATLFGIGKIVFREVGLGVVLLAVAGGAFAWIARALKAQDEQEVQTQLPPSFKVSE
jgi:Na+/proline symporter